MRSVVAGFTTAALLSFVAIAAARSPRSDLAGLRLGMSEEQAHESLAKRGTRLGEHERTAEREEHESWSLAQGSWAYVAYGVDEGRVIWITAFARKTGTRVRYRDLGSLADCKRTGTYFFTWNVPKTRDSAPHALIARGTDSVYVMSASLVRDTREAVHDGSAEPDSGR